MKIGIDISQIVFEGTGVATYTRNLVENLLKIDRDNSYVLFGASLRQQGKLNNFTVNKKIILPIPPTALSVLWNDLHIFPVENFVGKIDVFHSSDWTEPPSKAKKVTTIHDLIIYKTPESSHPQIITTQKKKLEWVKKECNLIIVDSESTRKDCGEILDIPKDKIRVIYLAAGEDFNQFEGQSITSKEHKIRLVKQKYNLTKKYILAVGTREPRKNLSKLIEAFTKLHSIDVDLVLVGKYGWGDEITPENIRLLGFVPQEDLPALYAGAEVFAYPSLYEGFGIPILEAMTVGCPVVTSNISSMSEAAGDAAIYANPLSEEDIALKIKMILKFSVDARRKLIERGFNQAKKFSWSKTARETLGVYREATKIA